MKINLDAFWFTFDRETLVWPESRSGVYIEVEFILWTLIL